jgi:hypothetical protein
VRFDFWAKKRGIKKRSQQKVKEGVGPAACEDYQVKACIMMQVALSTISGRTEQKIRLPLFQDRLSGRIADCTYKV